MLYSLDTIGHPRIARDPAICGGRPTVAGTRMRVTDVLEMLAGGVSEAEIVADFPYVKLEDIRACQPRSTAHLASIFAPIESRCRWSLVTPIGFDLSFRARD